MRGLRRIFRSVVVTLPPVWQNTLGIGAQHCQANGQVGYWWVSSWTVWSASTATSGALTPVRAAQYVDVPAVLEPDTVSRYVRWLDQLLEVALTALTPPSSAGR